MAFLYNSGLLFKINKEVLHPLGMALAVIEDDQGDINSTPEIMDFRNDPEGMTFEKESFINGQAKENAYMESRGSAALEVRKKILGYIVQPDENS